MLKSDVQSVRTRLMVASTLAVAMLTAGACSVGGKSAAPADRRDTSAAAEHPNTPAPTDHRKKVSGSDREYLEAVCQPGGFVDGIKTTSGMFNGALGGGTCTEPRAGGSDIFMTQWDSGDKMERTMANLAMCYVAATNSDGSEITVLSVVSNGGDSAAALNPLAQFGLTVRC